LGNYVDIFIDKCMIYPIKRWNSWHTTN